jgi:hypothetical protein
MDGLIAVIASEAKQSISLRKERLDCFVASLLAMTVEPLRHCERSKAIHAARRKAGLLHHFAPRNDGADGI